MELRFLGTRGDIEARTARHRMHSALLVVAGRRRIMIDCGADWAGRFQRLRPDAILITHAHSDHAAGLTRGAACPVYATEETWSSIRTGAIPEKFVLRARSPFEAGGIEFEAFPVEHSIRAPAVGYRIRSAQSTVFYVPDLVRIYDRNKALGGIDLYIGDGASVTRPIIRKRGKARIGHESIRAQIEWCREEGVDRAIFTHCGSEIVARDERAAAAKLRLMARQAGVQVRIAYDGLRVFVL